MLILFLQEYQEVLSKLKKEMTKEEMDKLGVKEVEKAVRKSLSEGK